MPSDTYLTEAELATLTRRKYAKAQIRVLARMGWTFTVDGDNRPVVLRAYHDRMLGLASPEVRRRGPRLTGLAAA